jgi:ABC-type proline/glycine betaine transport system permease subunit
MSKLLDFLSGGAAKVIDSIGNVIDNVTTTQEEKLTLKNEAARIVGQEFLNMQMVANEEMANARNREIELKNSIGGWTQNLAAALVIISFLVCIFVWMFIDIRTANKDMLYMLTGSLGTLVVQIFSYWFGSSVGSQKKDIRNHDFNTNKQS